MNHIRNEKVYDIDVGIHVTIHPEDFGNGHGYHCNPERIGLTRGSYLGLAFSDGNDGLFQMFRLIQKNGIRFDIGFYITLDETKPIYHIPKVKIQEIKEEGSAASRAEQKRALTLNYIARVCEAHFCS